MTPGALRRLRVGLLVGAAGLALAVVWSLRRRPAAPAASPNTPTTLLGQQPGATRLGGFTYRKLDEAGNEQFTLEAESMVGREQEEVHLRRVHATFPYTARGQTGRAQIHADQGVYWPAQLKAVFQGHVKVVSEDGFELTGDELIYKGERGVVHTDHAVQFRRKDVSGSGTGLHYDAEEAKLKLLADATLKVEGDEGGPPLEVRGAHAELDRADGVLRFGDGVEARQGAHVLRSKQLQIFFDPEAQTLAGALAQGEAELHTVGGQAIPGAAGTSRGSGSRILKGQRLDIVFRPDRTLQTVTAGPDAELTVLPGPKDERLRRRLGGKFLTFQFDEAGRLVLVEGQKEGRLVTEPMPPAKGLPRVLTCRRFVARVDPASGEIAGADFAADVELVQGTRKARSQAASYDAAGKRFVLDGEPELLDSRDGGRLTADVIQVSTETGDLVAEGDVAHFLGSRGPRRQGLLTPAQNAVVRCRRFEYDSRARTAHYRQGALLRSGADEVRAPLLKVVEAQDGTRTVTGADGVVTLFHPKAGEGSRTPAPVETRSQQLAYEEAKGQLVYTGQVSIRQGDIHSDSPEAVVTLAGDGSTVQTMVAGEPVEIRQGARKASGRRATYTPATETLVLVGDQVVLADPSQQVTGRSLTFHVADDRIIVDGREEVRTETVFRKEPPRP